MVASLLVLGALLVPTAVSAAAEAAPAAARGGIYLNGIGGFLSDLASLLFGKGSSKPPAPQPSTPPAGSNQSTGFLEWLLPGLFGGGGSPSHDWEDMFGHDDKKDNGKGKGKDKDKDKDKGKDKGKDWYWDWYDNDWDGNGHKSSWDLWKKFYCW